MNKHSSSVVTATGYLSTPYASRGSRADRSSDYPGAMRTSLVGRSPYSPITDPHLKNYYRNKFISALSLSRIKGSVHVRPQSAPSVQSSVSSYKVTVRTGHTGTSAKVYVTLTGFKGRLLRQRLSKGGRKEMTFNPGSTEVFRVRGGDIGPIRSLTIENEGLKVNDGWFLENVSVTNQDGEKWNCPFNQWLSLHHTDCQLIRQSKARPYTPRPRADACYSLKVHTGDVRGASTGANVFITVHGTKGSSPKTHLSGPFDRACVVEASLQAPDVGRVTTLTVEHDNSGFGPDWFLDYISVSYKDTSSYFPCAQWLSRSEGDGAIQRTLSGTPRPPPPYVGKSYIVTIVTGSQRGAGTQANVYLTLEGTVGSSGEKRLDNDPDNYTKGRTDIFVVTSCDLGTLTNATVRHDNSGPHPGWFLESVCVSCDGVEVCFPCGRWLELCGGCGGVTQVKLLPSDKETEQEEFKESRQYVVTVETGNRPGASTTANVYVILHGCHGDSGRLWLSGSSESFASGAVDQFTVTMSGDGVGGVTDGVGGVESVWVGHDNSGPSPGWFLKQVSVSGGDGVWVCPCDRWLCVDSGDGRIERELHPLPASEEGACQGVWSKWTIHVWTSDMRGAGTDANVTIQIHGSHGDSSVIPLGDGVANFEQGEHDVFRDVGVCEGVGVVESVSVCHDGARPYSDWHLEKLAIINQSTGDKYLCLCNKWLIANKDGTGGAKVKLTAVLQAPPPESILMASPQTTPTRSITSQYVSQLRGDTTTDTTTALDTLPYTVCVLSGAPPLCDPAPFLTITLIGKETSTQPIRLQRLNSTGYVPGRSDTFSVQCLDIGPISRLKVVLEAPSHCPPWLIEQITIDSPTLGHTHQFPCGRGLSPGLEVILEELSNTGSSSLMLSTNTHTQPLTGYEVKVYTSDKKAASTLNNLHLILRGESGDSQPITIKNRSMFQRGQTDTLQIATSFIGRLVSLLVGHSPHGGRGSSLPWYLFQMVVTELSSGVKTTFPCRQWLPASQQGKPLNYTTLHKTQI